MPQTKEQRAYWANRRKQEDRRLREDTQHIKKRSGPVVLAANSVAEYEDIVRIHPGVKVRLDESALQQTQLFDTRSLKDV